MVCYNIFIFVPRLQCSFVYSVEDFTLFRWTKLIVGYSICTIRMPYFDLENGTNFVTSGILFYLLSTHHVIYLFGVIANGKHDGLLNY